MTGYRWVEYAVRLKGGQHAACASREVACRYAHGWPMCRTVLCTPVDKTGDAVVDIGPWVPLAGAA